MRTHGAYGTYTAGCRCDPCKAAKCAYQRERRRVVRERANRHTELLPGNTGWTGRIGARRHVIGSAAHGQPATYIEQGCRCWPCTDAYSGKRAIEKSRQFARARAVA